MTRPRAPIILEWKKKATRYLVSPKKLNTLREYRTSTTTVNTFKIRKRKDGPGQISYLGKSVSYTNFSILRIS